MRDRPDLTYPLLPDAVDLDAPVHARGASVTTHAAVDDFEWPEAGPSRLPASADLENGSTAEPRMGPYGSKMVAAMTGAVTTSLLSKPISEPHARSHGAGGSPRFGIDEVQ